MEYKPKQIVDLKTNSIVAFIVFLGALIVYALTQSPTLSFWDAGEYVTCSSILGIPHPPGNPTYILLGRFFTTILTSFQHASVINLLSGILSALAVMFTYLATVKLVSLYEKDKFLIIFSGFIAAFYIAFSFTFWNNAIEAEVYSGLAFVLNIIIWLTLIWVEKSEDLSHLNLLLLIIYIFFLGFGIHQTSLQLAPAVLFIVFYPTIINQIKKDTFWYKTAAITGVFLALYFIFNYFGKVFQIPDLSKMIILVSFFILLHYFYKEKVPGKVWVLAIVLILIGLSTHIFLFIRSSQRPFINEGAPSTVNLFTEYILRRQYGVTSFAVRRASFFYQIKEQFLEYFSWQFFNSETISSWLRIPQNLIAFLGSIIVWFLGLFGAIDQYKKNKHSFFYLFSF
ncbi:MAG: DUF2723 domain-containing protein, partial [Candidatus Cloacimonetes bacterium]|nr:DUF2723 domain-containing protein [Candidatus Cloacimonadota bacterium]